MTGYIVTLLAATITGGGLYGFLQFLIKRKDDKSDELHKIQKDIGRLVQRADEGDLNDSRIQLMMLIWHNPRDHRAILKEAEKYFGLGGDGWIYNNLSTWARQQGVDIRYLEEMHNKNTKGDRYGKSNHKS